MRAAFRISWLAIGLASLVSADAAGAGALVEFANVSERGPATLVGYLARPDQGLPALLASAGHRVERFPAVVVLHECGGISSHSVRIADRLGSEGYVALAVDSLGPRGVASRCDSIGSPEQAFDAYSARSYLAQQVFVDAARIAVLGQSMGGNAVFYAVDRDMAAEYFTERFQAAIAYYPACLLPLVTLTAPTLILAGERDDWTPWNAAARWLLMRGPMARRLRCTSTRAPAMPSMLRFCSPAAALLATRSNTTRRRPRTRKKRRGHFSMLTNRTDQRVRNAPTPG
jgi:dienelactone hydrolase